MITEFDIPISRIADIYEKNGWFPVMEDGSIFDGGDLEEKIREAIHRLLRYTDEEYDPKEGSYTTETMRLRVERFEDFGQIYLNIGSVEW